MFARVFCIFIVVFNDVIIIKMDVNAVLYFLFGISKIYIQLRIQG